MSGFSNGNLFGSAERAGNRIKDKFKKAVKRQIKKLLKKVIKRAFKMLIRMLGQALASLATVIGVPLLICMVVIIIVGGALVFIRFLESDDEAYINAITAKYTTAIEKTSAIEEYRPPMIVVQAIDNMRITKLDLDPNDIAPSMIANMLKPDLKYQDFYNTTSTNTSYYDKKGKYKGSSASSSKEKVSLLVSAHTWNRQITKTYSEHSETSSYSYSDADGRSETTTTTTEWVEDVQPCTIELDSNSTSPAPNLITGNGTKTNPFFTKWGPLAMEESKSSGVPASVTLAQAVQEGGWGSSLLATKYFNFFGIKKHDWPGDTVLMWTTEYINGVSKKVQAEFRAYPSAVAGFADHSKFLLDNPRYKTALSKENPYEFANELQAAGYATDPTYAYSLKKLIHDYNLTQYDPDKGINPETGTAWGDVGYVPKSNAGVLTGCGTADYTKFDATLNYFNFTTEDVELIAAGIKEYDTSHTLLAGYNGEYGVEMSDTPLVGSDSGDYVDVGPVQPGQMIWPTTAKYLTSNFGMRVNPVSGVYKLHKGIDIAPANSDARDYPNIAAMDGMVIAAGDSNDGYGNKVVIDHGGGLETLYAHMKVGSLNVSVGQEVIAGTVLGIMGQTGNAAGRHLHFEVHVNGKPTNPLAYVHKN